MYVPAQGWLDVGRGGGAVRRRPRLLSKSDQITLSDSKPDSRIRIARADQISPRPTAKAGYVLPYVPGLYKRRVPRPYSCTSFFSLFTMTCSLASNGTTRPYRVLVVGASYAGLAFTVNLLDLCHGLPCRFATGGADAPAVKDRQVPVDITIADERDGYCKSSLQPYLRPFQRSLTSSMHTRPLDRHTASVRIRRVR